jgi:hypothetical protein
VLRPPTLAPEKKRKDGARWIQGPSATRHHQQLQGDAWNGAMEKMENKERFPLSHGTATTILMNLITIFVALGI